MSPETMNNQSRAANFAEQHIQAPDDYAKYFEEVVAEWQASKTATTNGAPQKSGFWLRSNGDSYDEFAAHINYMAPSGTGFGCLAAIDIANEGDETIIQVWAAKSGGSGEPEVVSAEPYSPEALERAITLAESR
jgi:hypothetical protein